MTCHILSFASSPRCRIHNDEAEVAFLSLHLKFREDDKPRLYKAIKGDKKRCDVLREMLGHSEKHRLIGNFGWEVIQERLGGGPGLLKGTEKKHCRLKEY